MTGVRGRGPREKLAFYHHGMREMFAQAAWVLKPAAKAAFVVGDARAFDIGSGGWETRLVGIFGRTLGPRQRSLASLVS